MLNLRLIKTRKKGIARDQNGFTLIEAVIGTALLVAVGAAVLMGVSTAFKASATADKISTALALAQSQIEYIQTQDYQCADGAGNATYKWIDDATRGSDKQDIPSNYSISITAVSVDEVTGAVVTTDAGFQRITVVVGQVNNLNPVTLVAYKVKPTATACP